MILISDCMSRPQRAGARQAPCDRTHPLPPPRSPRRGPTSRLSLYILYISAISLSTYRPRRESDRKRTRNYQTPLTSLFPQSLHACAQGKRLGWRPRQHTTLPWRIRGCWIGRRWPEHFETKVTPAEEVHSDRDVRPPCRSSHRDLASRSARVMRSASRVCRRTCSICLRSPRPCP